MAGRMPARGLRETLCGAVLLLPAACARRPDLDTLSAHRVAARAFPAHVAAPALARAADDPSERVNPFLPWPPTREGGPGGRRHSFGVSVTVAAPERADWAAVPRAGLFYDYRARESARLILAAELGEERDAGTSLDLLVTQARLGLAGRIGVAREVPLRPVYEVGVAYERADVEGSDASFDRYVLLGSLGVETGPRPERWKVRLEFVMLASRSDVDSEAAATFVLCF